MSCIPILGGTICGNFVGTTKKKPRDWIESGYRIVVPYRFKWRAKIGKATCDCTMIEESYQPWYGTSWYHAGTCALGKHLKRYPGIENLVEVAYPLIAQTE